VVILVSAMRGGITARRAEALRSSLDIGERTLRRWRQWWREAFIETPFWKAARGRFLPPVHGSNLPTSLLERFAGRRLWDRLLRLLEFLLPLTTASPWPVGR
jgi:hypothetical protein